MKEAPVVQWIERQIPVLNVGGSSPFGRTKEKSSESLDFKGFSGLFPFLKAKLQMTKIDYFKP